eukprot:scaffold3804_cov197-Pinguiococcus_pyrenoidosus.AAC.2
MLPPDSTAAPVPTVPAHLVGGVAAGCAGFAGWHKAAGLRRSRATQSSNGVASPAGSLLARAWQRARAGCAGEAATPKAASKFPSAPAFLAWPPTSQR